MGDLEAITSEITWLEALSLEVGLAVPAPVMTLDGKLLSTIKTPGIFDERVISLMRWLDVRSYHKRLQPKHMAALGEVVAQLHNFSAVWQPHEGFTRAHWYWHAQLGATCSTIPWMSSSLPSLSGFGIHFWRCRR